MRRPPMASRTPASRPAGVRRFRLRLAGLAEVLRLKYDLTMAMVGEGVPAEVDGDKTVRLPRETMAEIVHGRAA
jgi:hypothetical protein